MNEQNKEEARRMEIKNAQHADNEGSKKRMLASMRNIDYLEFCSDVNRIIETADIGTKKSIDSFNAH